ncbi:hypothetical protein EV643_103506 [Kribbella sp. VKM Ac-2527]|uniref:Uncharacterized protein n=1 Tax=Kribbella caucasensis TaxID=2512215 RepID=A0A4R6KKA7_9ACTN|nr:hypothetical protein EV643_103506 [Kribbella sp. VKM Ac-2527]
MSQKYTVTSGTLLSSRVPIPADADRVRSEVMGRTLNGLG